MAMTRIDQQSLALHLEVALSGAASHVVADLAQPDRYRRQAAVSTLAHYLANRMDGFEVLLPEPPAEPTPLPLFPDLNGDVGRA